MTKTVLVGATGLVGANLVDVATRPLHILARRAGNIARSGNEETVADSDEWPDVIAGLQPDIVISCLGTTIAKAGSKSAFAAVDHDLVIAVATAAKEAGAKQMICVSSVGASTESSNFYLQTKGRAEAALEILKFDRLDIFRPGLLIGHRDEFRFGENIGKLLAPVTDFLMRGSLSRYRSTSAQQLAQAIYAAAGAVEQGRFIHENDGIDTLTAKMRG